MGVGVAFIILLYELLAVKLNEFSLRAGDVTLFFDLVILGVLNVLLGFIYKSLSLVFDFYLVLFSVYCCICVFILAFFGIFSLAVYDNKDFLPTYVYLSLIVMELLIIS